MKSYVLKTIFSILVINVTFCRGYCWDRLCKASCYFKNNGYDFGYCENNSCKCALPEIFVFDGVGGDLSERDIHASNSFIQNTIDKSVHDHGLTKKTSDEITITKTWIKIKQNIILKNPSITEEHLEKLKAKIINNKRALNDLSVYLQQPLKDALHTMKKKYPNTSDECEEILNILLRSKNTNNKAETSNEKNKLDSFSARSLNKEPNISNKNNYIQPKEVTNSKHRKVVEEEETKKKEIIVQYSNSDSEEDNHKHKKIKNDYKPHEDEEYEDEEYSTEEDMSDEEIIKKN